MVTGGLEYKQEHRDLTADQRKTFSDDIKKPQKISDLLPYINDPACRAQLIYFGGLLAHADGLVDPNEDAILKKLRADQLSSLDMEKIRGHVRDEIEGEMLHQDLRESELHPQNGFTAVLDALLLRLGIDVMD